MSNSALLIFLNGEKDENEVIGNMHIHLDLPLTLPSKCKFNKN